MDVERVPRSSFWGHLLQGLLQLYKWGEITPQKMASNKWDPAWGFFHPEIFVELELFHLTYTPENQWLEDVFSAKTVPLLGIC